jgi:hypothetical protein
MLVPVQRERKGSTVPPIRYNGACFVEQEWRTGQLRRSHDRFKSWETAIGRSDPPHKSSRVERRQGGVGISRWREMSVGEPV